MIDIQSVQNANAIAFILANKIVNENSVPIEFRDHRFLVDPYLDENPEQVIIKSAQVGWSTLEIIKSIHQCHFLRANVIYTLPSRNVVKDFVLPKVNPLIDMNPALKALVGETNSISLKKIGDRFLYFRGSWEQMSAISISGHILKHDEFDRSNQKVLKTYRSRLDAAKRERPDLGWEVQFSNPSIPGNGVDEKWQLSDMKHWFIKCPHCNQWQFLNFPDNIDFEREIYICKKCHKELDDITRRMGQWVNKRNSSISGYWINQMMVPWIPAKKIIEDSLGDQSIFYNFTLGLPYISKEQGISRQIILNDIILTDNPRVDVAMGVDNGVVKHYVIGNRYGIFEMGSTESWDDIEDLRNRYGATMVIDALPYPTMPKRLAQKYNGKVFVHYYVKDIKEIGTIWWGENNKRLIVESDRTKIIDQVVADLNSGDIVFNLNESQLEEYIIHWGNLYRTVELAGNGIIQSSWKTIGQETGTKKPDHLAHATIYWRIALEKAALSGGIVKPEPINKRVISPHVDKEGNMPALDIRRVIERAKKKRRDWRSV